MKVGFFFNRAERDEIESLLRSAQESSVPAVAYRFSSQWQDLEFEQFRHNFEDLTHLVLTGVDGELKESWSTFIAGIALRRDLSLFFNSEAVEIPQLFSTVPQFHSAEDLFAYLKEQRLYHDRIGSIEDARNELIAEGLAITEQAMDDAVAEGREDDVIRFMHLGFDADTRDSRGVPLLSIAIKNRRQTVVDLLLSRGADVNLTSHDRLTTPLMEAAVLGEEGIADTLIKAGADLNLQSHNGQTALMMAISEGHTGVVERLLNEGCETNQVDQLGMTPRKYAELFNKKPIVDLIREYEERKNS